MNHYILTHIKMDGEVELGYDAKGRLILWHIRAELNDKSYLKLLRNIPTEESNVDAYKSRGFMVRLIPPDLSFERFYTEFGNPKSKLKAEKLWDKMSKADKMAAILAIPTYLKSLQKSALTQAYPDTWLRNKRWTDG